jgi:hypothetical protein
VWKYMPVIPAACEVKAGGLWVWGQSWAKVVRLSQNQNTNKMAGGVAQVVASMRPWVQSPILSKRTKANKQTKTKTAGLQSTRSKTSIVTQHGRALWWHTAHMTRKIAGAEKHLSAVLLQLCSHSAMQSPHVSTGKYHTFNHTHTMLDDK